MGHKNSYLHHIQSNFELADRNSILCDNNDCNCRAGITCPYTADDQLEKIRLMTFHIVDTLGSYTMILHLFQNKGSNVDILLPNSSKWIVSTNYRWSLYSILYNFFIVSF